MIFRLEHYHKVAVCETSVGNNNQPNIFKVVINTNGPFEHMMDYFGKIFDIIVFESDTYTMKTKDITLFIKKYDIISHQKIKNFNHFMGSCTKVM